MPLLHKPSKSKLRKSSVPAPLDLSSTNPVPGALPTPPLTASSASAPASTASDSSFKFWKKSSPPGSSSVPSTPPVNAPMPKPILRRPSDGLPSPSIRFAQPGQQQQQALPQPPAQSRISVAQPQPQRMSVVSTQAPAQAQAYTSTRPRSSSQSGSQSPYAQIVPPARSMTQPPSAPATQTSFARVAPPAARPVSTYTAPMASAPSLVPTRAPSARRSSRPTSPSSTSFGARVLPPSIAQILPAPTSSSPSPLTTPPMGSASHVTTPPAAYVSTMQTRAPPPPSPYRPTSSRETQQPIEQAYYPDQAATATRPPRHSSLFRVAPVDRNSVYTPSTPDAPVIPMFGSVIDNSSVPMLNIIPATPQETSEEFAPRKRSSGTWSGLDDAALIDEKEMVEVALDSDASTPMATPATVVVSLPQYHEDKSSVADLISHPSMPVLDLDLDFSPFEPLVSLPSSSTISTVEALPASISESDSDVALTLSRLQYTSPEHVDDEDFETHARRASTPPTDPLPPSPPFESYPSLPSLASMPSSSSADSIRSSSSELSLSAFPDVEEALGSMLRSLSNDSVVDASTPMPIAVPTQRQYMIKEPMAPSNPGLGLGLDLPDHISSVSVTAPLSLSPRRRSPAPPPLDLGLAKRANVEPAFRSAPPVINHRVAFYNSTRPYPGSSSSSLAYSDQLDSMSDGDAENDLDLDEFEDDDDLHTASIISLTPVLSERPIMVETDLVGLAL